MIDIHIARSLEEQNLCFKIREEVFVKGQNIAPELEKDGLDSESEHVILYNNANAVGCARIRYVHGNMKLGRIAVLEEMRGLGLGKKIMQFLVDYSKTKDVLGIEISAQKYLEKFYSELGFVTQGAPYSEAGIPHVMMYRQK